ncbi:MAG: YggT family protein [Firmicutes bacterium HGW-Firmicutes-14]|jgi:hypothetical protein|nr:MAG: YggT family protein [Firmicutes bacterium HGW-Firmicutes-14]
MEHLNFNKNDNGNLKARQMVYYILGILEVLFAFRLVFKLLGANPASGFVSFIYSLTQIFLSPFASIFRSSVTKGNVTTAVFEPSTVIGMIVYAILAWGIARLIEINTARS